MSHHVHALKKTLVIAAATTAISAVVPTAAYAQMFIGGGGGLSVIPHAGRAICGGHRDAVSASTAELRLGVTLSSIDVSARGALAFGHNDAFADECFQPPGSRATINSYARDRQAHSIDLNAWYLVQKHLKIGGELGAFPEHSVFVGAGAGFTALGFQAEVLGRIHRVPLTTTVYEYTSTGPPLRVSTSKDSELALGLSLRVVFVGY
jgi:hypothetical protein